MSDAVAVAIIAAGVSPLVTVVVFFLTKRHERTVQLRNDKLNHYRVLFSAVSDLAADSADKEAANVRLALAVNTIALAAPQKVIAALMAFLDPNQSPEVHDRLLNELLLAVRRDIGLAKGDDVASFAFHLIGRAQIAYLRQHATSRPPGS